MKSLSWPPSTKYLPAIRSVSPTSYVPLGTKRNFSRHQTEFWVMICPTHEVRKHVNTGCQDVKKSLCGLAGQGSGKGEGDVLSQTVCALRKSPSRG